MTGSPGGRLKGKLTYEKDGGDLFLLLDGVRIAKRGRPGELVPVV